jgi:hypothetical protein
LVEDLPQTLTPTAAQIAKVRVVSIHSVALADTEFVATNQGQVDGQTDRQIAFDR